MLISLITLLLAQSGLSSDDPAERLAAAEKWDRSHRRPQLSSVEARALTACVEVPALPETGCARATKLCRLDEGDDGSGGTRIQSLSLMWVEPEEPVQALRMWWWAGYEPRLFACDPPEPLDGPEPREARAKTVAAWRKDHAKEYAACVKRLTRYARQDAEELACDLVLMNACRKEAYVRCTSQNLRKGITALQHLHRFEF